MTLFFLCAKARLHETLVRFPSENGFYTRKSQLEIEITSDFPSHPEITEGHCMVLPISGVCDQWQS